MWKAATGHGLRPGQQIGNTPKVAISGRDVVDLEQRPKPAFASQYRQVADIAKRKPTTKR